MVLVHESDARFGGAFDFGAAYATAPDDLKEVISNHESLPFRRRGYERDGMLRNMIKMAGFKSLMENAHADRSSEKAQESAVLLAAVPTEVQHFDLESFYDRPVQTELVELLLLPIDHKRFTNHLLIYGMGGTGKTVTAVALVQDTAVRTHFSNIYWLTVGQDAVGSQIRQLQGMLHNQLTGQVANGEGKDEQEWLGMLMEAMKMARALVVLDDPWLPEQLRFLNPIDRSSRTGHRLLVTTRIRDLQSKATCIELTLMGTDEAVYLLLGLANIQKGEYMAKNRGSPWPPPDVYDIAAECGLLPMTLSIAAQVIR
jgi:hypothetical protein